MADKSRLRIAIRGAVQGVGFRPFIYRLATELRLDGWVNNSAQGVFLEVEGEPGSLQNFLLRLESEKPSRSFIQSMESSWLDPVGYSGFEIRASEARGARIALVMPDLATCSDCLREIFQPGNRRFFYPFTNCTNCGPRFSIIESLPYDRPNTSMKGFSMCPQCQKEYEDPADRRFHAQPNACPACGPRLELWNREGKPVAATGPPEIKTFGAPAGMPIPGDPSSRTLVAAAEALRQGRILALKGIGGFQLMVAAGNEAAVRRLRELKHREEKPFALMFPSLESIKALCTVSPLEERLLRSPESPIVLLRRLPAQPASTVTQGESPSFVSGSIAPNNPCLGVMLPYTPLHHLLLALLRFPVVATSGNLSDEPICTDEHEALKRLGDIADLFLVHNRPIVRHVDDSIVRVIAGRETLLRRARGYAPLPVHLSESWYRQKETNPRTILAVGAHLKNTVALSVGPQVFLSQHIGDLETDAAYEAFRRVIGDFQKLYEVSPSIIAADAHPDYLSTKFAKTLPTHNAPGPQSATLNPRLISVQHHVAHVLSCMAENQLDPPLLGVSWDGTGYGLDGSIWGGEFFLITENANQRLAHLRKFRLPGGDKAIKEPRRTALGLLYEMFGDAVFEMSEVSSVSAFSSAELAPLKTMLSRQVHSPLTSSVGRLFDAVASLLGLRQHVRFEGQAAMELEFAIGPPPSTDAYPFPVEGQAPVSEGPLSPRFSLSQPAPLILNWFPLIEAILSDLKREIPATEISAKFHNSLVEAIVAVARHARQERVAVSGGCFQNRHLTERAVQRLREEGFRPYWHQRVPPNDGGIALGQIVAALS